MSEVRFAVDASLVPLAKKLRTLGVDVKVCYSEEPGRVLLICRKEGRILLTKKCSLIKFFEKYGQKVFYIKDEKDLKRVIEHFKLKPERARCPYCNRELLPTPREEVIEKVPLYVFLNAEKFSRCPSCGRIFWRGSHLDWVKEVIPDGSGETETDKGNKDSGKRG
ncbi:Mut7-C RNAse domain-containing protein [Thermotoga petrophila]|jgi:uncharacterized protein with PIN domain|uniref:Mut7-C RNAse domain-containing protein n=1 Tax=Thermotoga petrophila TaxID=93929 RepID=UPI002FDF2BBB|nr:hypothetical protein [Thermotoga sp.]